MANTPLWQAYLFVFELPIVHLQPGGNLSRGNLEVVSASRKPLCPNLHHPPLDMLACMLDASLPGGCYASAHSIRKHTHPQKHITHGSIATHILPMSTHTLPYTGISTIFSYKVLLLHFCCCDFILFSFFISCLITHSVLFSLFCVFCIRYVFAL